MNIDHHGNFCELAGIYLTEEDLVICENGDIYCPYCNTKLELEIQEVGKDD